jgi:hypothetical protein
MRYSLNNPGYWHKRADETRAMADNLKNPEARDAMLTIAESYDGLARDAVKRASPDEETSPTPNPRHRTS